MAELIDALEGEIAVLAASGAIVQVNAAWRALEQPGALAGRGFPVGTDYRAAAAKAGHGAAIEALWRGALPALEYECPGDVWFRLTLRQLGDQRVVHHLDVTTSRRSLHAMRSRLAAVVENTPNVAIQAYDRDGRVLWWNKASELMYGWSADEAIGKTLDHLILTTEEHEAFVGTLGELSRTGQPAPPFTLPFRNKAGHIGIMYSTLFPVPVEGGTHEFICMDVDITALHRGEAAQSRLVALLEATTDFVAITDLAGTPVYLNRALKQALGLGEGQTLEKLPLELVYTPDTARFLRNHAFPAAIRDGSWSGEATFVGADGVARPTSQVVLSHKSQTGEVELVSTIARDLTEQKALEAQLLQSQKMEGIGRLAGGIAHDFNNVLTAIVGSTELLKLSLPRDHPARDGVDHIVKASHRARDLTRQLLTFARKQAHAPRVVSLNRIILNTESMLRRLIGEDIELLTLPAPGHAAVVVDPGHFEQMLVNLVVNARDAMPRGGKLVLSLENVTIEEGGRSVDPPPGRYVRLIVSDTGSGMTEDVLNHVFEPFFTTKEPGKGTGLGLATVYGVVKQSGGHIRVETAVGVGTTFVVDLPASSQIPAEDPRPQPAPATRGGSETLLLVEDEPLVRELAQRILGDAGYRVLTARDALEALSIAGAHPGAIDLMVTDVVMPHMSGRQLADVLIEQRPEVEVLYMSGYADELIEPHGIMRGGRRFLGKPFTPADLVGRVRELLDARRAR